MHPDRRHDLGKSSTDASGSGSAAGSSRLLLTFAPFLAHVRKSLLGLHAASA
jgi:hypothetical protein